MGVPLQWHGYAAWSRQIPTRDFRSPPGPITRSKLAKNVAKTVQRFIEVRFRLAFQVTVYAYSRANFEGYEIEANGREQPSLAGWRRWYRIRRP